MTLDHIVVHLIEKEQYKTDVETFLRAGELDISDSDVLSKVVSLMDKTRELYNKKSGKAYGEFEADSTLSRELKLLDNGDKSFLDLSRLAMADLKTKIALVTAATGGYMLFAKYKQNRENFFLIVMLKDTGGISFDENLNILDVNHLDLSNLHLAARINLSNWNLLGSKYISFIKGRSNADVRDYFKSFIGVTEFTESSENTKQMITALNNFYSEQSLPVEKRNQINDNVYAHCIEMEGYNQPARLEDVSRIVQPEKPEAFLEFANSESVKLNSEFHIDKPALRKLRRFSGKDKQVSITFDAKVYGERVRYNREKDELTIHGVPESLKNQLPEN